MFTPGKGSKTVDFWPWRQRTSKPGELRPTMFQLTLDETGAFPEARPIAGAQAADDDKAWPEFAETTPNIGRLEPE